MLRRVDRDRLGGIVGPPSLPCSRSRDELQRAGLLGSVVERAGQGALRTENMLSESVSPGTFEPPSMGGPAGCGTGHSPGRIPVRGCENGWVSRLPLSLPAADASSRPA